LHYQQHHGTGDSARTWNFIEYRRVATTNSTTSIPLKPFFNYAESSDGGTQMSNSWYLTGTDAGFEIWGGGLGLTVNSLSVAGL
jgi:hypothetical protein